MQRHRVWDIMREEFATVRKDQPLSEAMAALRAMRKSQPDAQAVVVLDDEGRYWGVLTTWGVLEAYEDCMRKIGATGRSAQAEIDFEAVMRDSCLECCPRSTAAYVRRDAPTIKPSETFIEALSLFLATRRNTIVVEEGGKPIGLAHVSDLFRALDEAAAKLG